MEKSMPTKFKEIYLSYFIKNWGEMPSYEGYSIAANKARALLNKYQTHKYLRSQDSNRPFEYYKDWPKE